ncbi:nitroreductase family protein [Pelagicoccus mobilis]|uniref:Nitroreductase family protein n=1 Tax=Pelagicoccus mobilis TaxID=415221 RepID=A0A934VNJ2_9BACT|nr:nitroreductase family protein [Pelagicoccus mobilis]MBK1876277.1 nitroreductase family protein [Pelagicoccus mobilis]
MSDTNVARIASELFKERCTSKALAEEAWPVPDQDGEKLAAILEAAGWAPFHKPAAREYRVGDQDGIEPWRCHVLDAKQCRELRQRLLDAGDTTKIPKMLAVADYLIQVTWLQEPRAESDDSLFDPSIQNMEHIAAASAAIQNMLLAATAREIPNYWSSGGKLRSPEVFEMLGITSEEILLGSVLLFPRDLEGAQVKAGALRHSRSEVGQWSRRVEL